MATKRLTGEERKRLSPHYKKARDATPGSPSDGAVVYDSDSDSQPKIVSDNTQQNASATAIHNTSSLPKVSSDPVINNGTESNEQLMDT